MTESHRPDRFFNADQQKRLSELLRQQKKGCLTSTQENELRELIEAEIDAARRRAESLTDSAMCGGSKAS